MRPAESRKSYILITKKDIFVSSTPDDLHLDIETNPYHKVHLILICIDSNNYYIVCRESNTQVTDMSCISKRILFIK